MSQLTTWTEYYTASNNLGTNYQNNSLSIAWGRLAEGHILTPLELIKADKEFLYNGLQNSYVCSFNAKTQNKNY